MTASANFSVLLESANQQRGRGFNWFSVSERQDVSQKAAFFQGVAEKQREFGRETGKRRGGSKWESGIGNAELVDWDWMIPDWLVGLWAAGRRGGKNAWVRSALALSAGSGDPRRVRVEARKQPRFNPLLRFRRGRETRAERVLRLGNSRGSIRICAFGGVGRPAPSAAPHVLRPHAC